MHLGSIAIFALATVASVTAVPQPARRGGSVSVTPHAQFMSSAGVLGCKINTNRVAYWPEPVSCNRNELCVRLTANARNVTLLKIDHSGGAHDISYDAWNYLVTGKSATEDPQQGGGISAIWEYVDMSEPECAELMIGTGGKLPLSATNSMVYNCGGDTWLRQNSVLYNINDQLCLYGRDEICTLKPDANTLATCPDPLMTLPGYVTTALVGDQYHVIDIGYGTGKLTVAGRPELAE